MLFAIFCLDRPDRGHLRKSLLDEHVAHFRQAGDAVRAAGPMYDDEGAKQVGSLIVYEAEDAGQARAFIDADPYSRDGLFEQVNVRRWDWRSGAGKPEA